MTAAVLVPVKAFHRAKLRLRPVLDDRQRIHLARTMAERVIRAAAGLQVAVVCDDEDVADWASGLGVVVIWAPGRGLNGAVAEGVTALGAAGADRVIVSHADLPFARDLRAVARFDGVSLVPDRHRDGTNVMGVPSASGFEFAYGPRSFVRHRHEAARLGLPARVIDDPRLSWDVDVAADLDFPADLASETDDLLVVPTR